MAQRNRLDEDVAECRAFARSGDDGNLQRIRGELVQQQVATALR